MIDIRLIRTHPEEIRAGLARRGVQPDVVDRILELDETHRELVARAESLRAEVKALSRRVREARRGDGGDGGAPADADDPTGLVAESRRLGDEQRGVAAKADAVAAELRSVLLVTPNLPAADCPDGAGPADNRVLRTVGYDRAAVAPHQRVPHWEIGAALGILDLGRAAKLSGSMFTMLRRGGATLARALCQLALDRNADAFEEVRPPSLVRTETMVSTGHLPKFAAEAYHVEHDDLWAIPTAEVPLTSLARDEILDPALLPVRLMAYTPCYRREAGAAGKDTRGLLRVHEFDKVELFAYTSPEQAAAVHLEILERAESTLAALGLAYRVVDHCTVDLGDASARTFDLDVYAPGCDQWLEASSVSWCGDYQARRANIRYRLPEGGTALVHTLNGSGLAVPRVWAALVETHRQPDGTVRLPEVLRPYFRGQTQLG